MQKKQQQKIQASEVAFVMTAADKKSFLLIKNTELKVFGSIWLVCIW